ncbi:MAG: hypothetical protein QOG18_2221 [Microbacteriaceae bacterium]|jgi:hypothetical protein|nr:hypothetical protein [Microbacteriaceae bacterium]MDQ1527608.1 hypothetical protein [Microbacteriaceae bacterium]
MRWDNLFDDLESQLEQELTAEEIDLQAEEERLRLARMSIQDRVFAIYGSMGTAEGSAIRLLLKSGETISVRPAAFGKDWFSADLVDDAQRHSQCVVPIHAIAALVLTREQVAQSLGEPAASGSTASPRGISARLNLAFVLRDLCRRRRSLELHLPGSVLHGTIDRVGRDHLDLAVHEPGTARRENEVTHYRLVPFEQVLFVRI